LLYEMFCGRAPFRGDSYHAVLSSILERRFVPLATLCPAVPAKLDSVVARALAQDRSQRWQSAADMREALLAAGSGVEATAIPPTALMEGPLEVVELDHWGQGASEADTRRSTPDHHPSPAPASIAPVAIELADLPPRRGHESSTLVVHPRRRRQLAPILWLVALLALLTTGAWFLLRPEPPSSPVPAAPGRRRH
jgi:serine/threonine-protein kinase